ncbi:hypothetical protein [Clostridium sp. BL8]|uniref:hypothetical protein n=1 Tax=Clostridium sp. BL8 TaxID=1354301 RepID=UPI00041D2ECC|nr:hypothetical protein [Clostridium sp. BL8]
MEIKQYPVRNLAILIQKEYEVVYNFNNLFKEDFISTQRKSKIFNIRRRLQWL